MLAGVAPQRFRNASHVGSSTATELPVSGTLFQYVVSVVAREDTDGDLSRFTVVPSRELTDFYNVKDLPRPFVFDGQSVVQPVSAQGSISEHDVPPAKPQSDDEPQDVAQDRRVVGGTSESKPAPATEAKPAVRRKPPARQQSAETKRPAAKNPPASRKAASEKPPARGKRSPGRARSDL